MAYVQPIPLPERWAGYLWIIIGILMLAVGLDSIWSDYAFGAAMLIGCAIAVFIGLMFFKSFRKRMLKALGRAPSTRVCRKSYGRALRRRLPVSSIIKG